MSPTPDPIRMTIFMVVVGAGGALLYSCLIGTLSALLTVPLVRRPPIRRFLSWLARQSPATVTRRTLLVTHWGTAVLYNFLGIVFFILYSVVVGSVAVTIQQPPTSVIVAAVYLGPVLYIALVPLFWLRYAPAHGWDWVADEDTPSVWKDWLILQGCHTILSIGVTIGMVVLPSWFAV